MMTTWCMWVCGLNSSINYFNVKNPRYLRGKCDNKEGDLNWAHPFPKGCQQCIKKYVNWDKFVSFINHRSFLFWQCLLNNKDKTKGKVFASHIFELLAQIKTWISYLNFYEPRGYFTHMTRVVCKNWFRISCDHGGQSIGNPKSFFKSLGHET